MPWKLELIDSDGSRRWWIDSSMTPEIWHDIEPLKELVINLKAGGQKVRIVQITDDDASNVWKDREQSRFDSGFYMPVPWLIKPELAHFCHISRDQPGKIAYTPSSEMGKADRQIRTRPGRYLSQFYPELSQDDIRAYCAQIGTEEYVFHITSDPDEIESAYVNGPNSCMSHDLGDYSSHIHPVRVYGDSPDLALAYLKHESSGRIVARTIVWPSKKEHTRIYGDESRLQTFLEDEGFTRGNDWSGARLQAIESGNAYVAPYIDFYPTTASYEDGFLVFSSNGDLELQQTNGLSDEGRTCQACGESCSDDYSHEGDYYCGSCFNESFSLCDCCDSTVPSDEITRVFDDSCVCESCRDRRYFYCQSCDEYHRNPDKAGEDSSGNDICESCAESLVFVESESKYYPPSEVSKCDCCRKFWPSVDLDDDSLCPEKSCQDSRPESEFETVEDPRQLIMF